MVDHGFELLQSFLWSKVHTLSGEALAMRRRPLDVEGHLIHVLSDEIEEFGRNAVDTGGNDTGEKDVVTWIANDS